MQEQDDQWLRDEVNDLSCPLKDIEASVGTLYVNMETYFLASIFFSFVAATVCSGEKVCFCNNRETNSYL